MKVLFQIRPALVEAIAARVPDCEVVQVPHGSDLPDEVRGEILVTYPWGSPNLREVLARGVRWVHVLGTGIDAFPVELLGGRTLTCSRGASAIPIAEWTLAVMLAFEKRLPETWVHEPAPRGSTPTLGTLHGKTLGLVGFGGIGRAVARRAAAFDVHIRALRATSAPFDVQGVEAARSLPDLVVGADHVVIAAPLTAATRHMFDSAVFAQMKSGAHLVNVARGGLVDQDALRQALDAGCIAAASLDAVEPEPLPAGHWMYGHPKVRLSPHVSWSMPDAAELLLQAFLDNLRRYQSGEPLQGVVDVKAGY